MYCNLKQAFVVINPIGSKFPGKLILKRKKGIYNLHFISTDSLVCTGSIAYACRAIGSDQDTNFSYDLMIVTINRLCVL